MNLIERLRNWQVIANPWESCEEAADRIERLEAQHAEDVALLRECLLFTMSRSLDTHLNYMRNVLKARLEKEQ